jgi:putative ABC transport system ATP-binding protein
MTETIIQARGLTKTYGSGPSQTRALRGVDLEIVRGSLTCIVGPSGHGKTTLMHLLGGLDRPSSGEVHLDGQDMFGLGDADLALLRSRKIGFVFQFFNLLPSLTARENVEIALMLAGVDEVRQEERAVELLRLVGLEDKGGSTPSQLSGGQQQRVAIARALANDPPVLLMDEPTGNLDSEAEAEVLAVLENLNRQGRTIILVTHSGDIAARATHLVRVRDGQIQPQ